MTRGEDSNLTNLTGGSLSGKVAIVVTHVREQRPTHHLEAFLVQRCHTVLSIYHPLLIDVSAKSRYQLFVNGTLVAAGERTLRGPEVAIRVQEVILTVKWVRQFTHRSDLFFGIDALNCISGLLLRPFVRIQKVIFYVIDWSPRRFNNVVLNGIYHLTDRVSALFANEIWNVSPVIDSGRWKGRLWSLIGQMSKNKTKIVGIGVPQPSSDLSTVMRIPHRLVFLGHLLEKQGLQIVIQALPEIAQLFSDVELLVIGDGPYQFELQALVRSLLVSDRVTFLGYVEDESDVLRHLASASVGVAPYLELEDSFTQYADPGKLKNYLAAGLPIIVTRVPYNAEYLEQSGCAILVKATERDIVDAVCRLFDEDPTKQSIRRAKARAFVGELDWVSVFSKAMNVINAEDNAD